MNDRPPDPAPSVAALAALLREMYAMADRVSYVESEPVEEVVQEDAHWLAARGVRLSVPVAPRTERMDLHDELDRRFPTIDAFKDFVAVRGVPAAPGEGAPQNDELRKAYDGWRRTLAGVPQENGEYAHLLICSGDRRQPPGAPGCVCRPCGPLVRASSDDRALRETPSDAQMRAALEAWPADLPLPSEYELAAIVRAVNRAEWPDAALPGGAAPKVSCIRASPTSSRRRMSPSDRAGARGERPA